MLLRLLSGMALGIACTFAAVTTPSTYFTPTHLLPGIGAGRSELTDEVLALRIEAMIQSQTFGIMREPQVVGGARRILSSDLQRLFRDAEHKSGFPAPVLAAMAFIESWGVANAESPAGPRGILQISESTGKRIGLRIVYSVRHRTIKTKVQVRDKHGRLVYRTMKHKETYTVLVRDDRLNPQKAVPAAAQYLAGMEQRYGGRDWAIWAYHCGEGCVSEFLSLAKAAKGLSNPPASVAKVFFGCSPAWNRELYQAIHAQMDRDYSPTYWFRIMRAQQLLALYQDDPAEFQDLAEEYKRETVTPQRAPDRLSVWLKAQDLFYDTDESIRYETVHKLVVAPDDPSFFGFQMVQPGPGGQAYSLAFPSTLGTVAYIAFETRRLYETMAAGGADFVPLDVTALVLPKNLAIGAPASRMMEHSSGLVFDISVARMPGSERECLQFVLDDLGWNGYLGFIEEPPGSRTFHIGCSPSSRDFFAQVFGDEQLAVKTRSAPPVEPPLLENPPVLPGPPAPPNQ